MGDISGKDLAYRALASAIGGPVDLATMVMRPFGYNIEKPTLGSEWIGQKMEQSGIVSAARDPLKEFAASIMTPSPGGLAAGLGKGATLLPAIAGMVKSGKVGDALKGIPKTRYKSDISRFDEEDVIDYANAIIKSTHGTPTAKDEAAAAALSGAGNKFVVYDGSKISGAAAFDVDHKTKTIFIDHIGSLIPGTGRQMVEEIEKSAQPGFKIVLTPSEEGVGFWKKMGFEETGRGLLMQKSIR